MQAPSHPEEADVFKAKEALRHGDVRPVGQYVGDLAEVLNRLADLFDPTDTKKGPPWQVQLVPRSRQHVRVRDKTARPREDEEWVGSLVQIRQAIDNGNVEAIGSYFRDAADCLRRLAAALNPPHDSKGWQLGFARTKAGAGGQTKWARC